MTQQAQTLGESEHIARCAIHPRYTEKDQFAAGLFEFKKVSGTANYVSSVGWRRKLPSVADVHAYGCRTAATSNKRKENDNVVVVPLGNKAHYLGFYDFAVGDACAQSNEIYEVCVEHCPENGEDAHCHLMLVEKLNLTKELQKQKSALRTHVLTDLWEQAVRGPEPHICPVDYGVVGIEEKVLPPAPLGNN